MSAGLRARVLARRRRWLAARALEALLVGGGVAAATLAAQRMSGPADARAARLVAVLCALLVVALLVRERWRDERTFTRRLDLRLGADGALSTACELERGSASDPFAGLLAARTERALEDTGWRGAASPPSPAFVAALLAGLALLAAVGEPGGDTDWSEVEALLTRVEGLAADPDAAPGAAEEALERLDAALATAQASPAREREARRRLEQARERLEGRERPRDPAERAPAAGSGQATLAAGAGDRTMSRPDGPPPMLPDRPTPSGADQGATPARSATWARRHDAVVAGYLERLPRE